MRLTNTIKLYALCKDVQQREDIHQALKTALGRDLKQVDYTTVKDDARIQHTYDPLYAITARLYTQPEQRAFIKYLRETMPQQQKERLQETAQKHVDEHLNFFFRLDKEAFLNGECKHVLRGDVIQARINLCAHPKTPATVLKQARALLA